MMLMERQFPHPLLPSGDNDDRARQDFVQTLKLHLATKIVPGIQRIYEERKEPEFKRSRGRIPADNKEVAALMEGNYYYRMWEALYRTTQEMIWSSVAEPILREGCEPRTGPETTRALGTLQLDPSVKMPRYLTAVDIHCMPGSYHGERFDGDMMQGALYDRGVHIYGMGGLGPKTDIMGRLVSSGIKREFPNLNPRRILDLGCSVGHSTLPYAEAFPTAELHAVDVAAPMLRYAHARAEAMGVEIHFKQMDAEKLNYPDDYFDLVVSHILMHETSNSALRGILKESRRVVRPGGLVAHVDMCFYDAMSPFNAFMMMFDGAKNNEPFWPTFRRMNAAQLLNEAGFEQEKMVLQQISRAYNGQAVFTEGKADGGRGTWQLMGGVK